MAGGGSAACLHSCGAKHQRPGWFVLVYFIGWVSGSVAHVIWVMITQYILGLELLSQFFAHADGWLQT